MFPPPRLEPGRLIVPLGGPHNTLSWAVTGGGLSRANEILIVQVGELGPEIDPASLLPENSVGMLTGRAVDRYEESRREDGPLAVRVVATVGLGNALAVGDSPGPLYMGTINIVVQTSAPLAEPALVEAISIAAEARTAAVISLGVESRRSSRVATGTGTDCIVLAAPDAAGGERWAGKHTAIGALIGAAVEEAVSRGGRAWLAEP
jgi:adenosylcobinamide amidohydrolase